MAGPLLLALLAAVTVGPAHAGWKQRDPRAPVVLRSDDVVARCQPGRLETYPSYLANGVQISLVARGPVDASADGVAEALTGFRITPAIINDASMLFISSTERPTSRVALDQVIERACRINQLSNFRLVAAARITDVREIRRAEAAAAAQQVLLDRERRDEERRAAAEAAAARQRLLRSPPTPGDLTEILREYWADIISATAADPMLAASDFRFHRVRDVRCRGIGGRRWRCRMGVLGTIGQDPVYEMIEANFHRQDDGSVVHAPPEIIVTTFRPARR